MSDEQVIKELNTAEETRELKALISLFWSENPIFHEILHYSRNLEEAREKCYHYIAEYERRMHQGRIHYNSPERLIAIRALQIIKNVMARRNEEITGQSTLNILWRLALGEVVSFKRCLIEEMTHLFRGIKGKSGLFKNELYEEINKNREEELQHIAIQSQAKLNRFPHGLAHEVIAKREQNKTRILSYFGASEENWQDWQWQCRNVIRDEETLAALVNLTTQEKLAVKLAIENKIAFGITPYYLSLFDYESGRKQDHALRAQVIPPLDYINGILAGRLDPSKTFDFMGEKDTSPEVLITRRYPMIAIFKPYNTCAQICVYCQRNWEIKDVLSKQALAPREKLEKALSWFAQHQEVQEILITGGDPGVIADKLLDAILEAFARLSHIRRIRIGTRTPVVLPMRLTENFAAILGKYHQPGVREITVMTHFEHSYEITPAVIEGVQRLKRKGISIYNQAVFTMENARRFELAALRKTLRIVGIDPYYTFNAKGKDETRAYRVPIARLLQEQGEEARLNPGLERIDEAVFNIPRLGKNYLRAGQDHELIMFDNEGRRIYEFYPWDKQNGYEAFLYIDVAIMDFLMELERRGEKATDYQSIWYYY